MGMTRPPLGAHCEDQREPKASVAPDTQKLSPQRQSKYWMHCCAWKALTLLKLSADTCAILVALDRTANCHLSFPVHLPIVFLTTLHHLAGRAGSNMSFCLAETLLGYAHWVDGQRSQGESASPWSLFCSASRSHFRLWLPDCWRALHPKVISEAALSSISWSKVCTWAAWTARQNTASLPTPPLVSPNPLASASSP